MMKLNTTTWMLLLTGILLVSCQPEEHREVGAPLTPAASLAGTWRLTRVLQTDEDAKNKGFTYNAMNIQQMDITNVFPYTDFRLTLNMNGAQPTSFTTTPGNAPPIIRLASGNWSFDDPAYPKVITMANATDTARITLGGYPAGASPVLKVVQERRDAATNKLLITYSYEFTKQ